MQLKKRHYLIGAITLAFSCLAFTSETTPAQKTAVYYDRQLDSLLLRLSVLKKREQSGANTQLLRKYFLDCRTTYKKVEFLIDVFNPYKAKQLNGPDLLKIEEENPGDSIKPHGFQTLEALLYTEEIDKSRLEKELDVVIQTTSQLRNDPDRIYYFKNDRIWEAMRLGVFRIISLGLTGFDVPSSNHAIPEARAVLASVQQVAGMYKSSIKGDLYEKGNLLFSKAIAFLNRNTDFNTFDRMAFTRQYLNPISAWLKDCSKQGGYINYSERTPLNPEAENLFAWDIMNIAFFSPNDKYRLTEERIALGRRLFYDRQLSGNGTRSCASCHQPEKAFTDGLARPTDLSGEVELQRNTPTLWNAALQTRQFYDSRTEKMENQLSVVVHNTNEMGGSLRNSIAKLAADKKYDSLFRNAYPENVEYISEYNIANAISSYVRSLVSFNSRFDRYMRRQTDSFTASEKNGYNLFMGKARCGTCHYAPVFNGLTPPLYQETESEILGVPATNDPHSPLDADPGKAGFTKVALHKYAFKTPTVRNSALTAPYMHNGVFRTLDEVLRFYNEGGGAGRGITLPTQTLPADKLKLSKNEIADIIAFLQTLTDY